MVEETLSESPRRGRLADLQDGVGQRLRAEREQRGVSLRELGRRLEISASALSQIETGRSRPSVSTLYAIVSELGMSLDELFSAAGTPPEAESAVSPDQSAVTRGEPDFVSVPVREPSDPVQRGAERRAITLESGVRWERLTPTAEQDTDFLFVVYDVGGSSSSDGTFIRHSGREYGLVLSGRLRVTIGFEDFELGPGDSVVFDSTDPHRLDNIGDEPVTAVWFVIGRRQSDARVQTLHADLEALATET